MNPGKFAPTSLECNRLRRSKTATINTGTSAGNDTRTTTRTISVPDSSTISSQSSSQSTLPSGAGQSVATNTSIYITISESQTKIDKELLNRIIESIKASGVISTKAKLIDLINSVGVNANETENVFENLKDNGNLIYSSKAPRGYSWSDSGTPQPRELISPKKTSRKKTSAKKTSAKKSSAKKSSAKKSTAKKTTGKKSSRKKSTSKDTRTE